MSEAPAHIDVELSSPCRVNGQPARAQSVWLLARLWHAQRHGDGTLPAAALRLGFPGQDNIRMLVSRAFSDFARWGVEVGWGAAREQPIATLARNGRSRGPFWLSADGARRLRLLAEGAEVERDWLEHFLGLRRPSAAGADQPGGWSHLMRDMGFWQQMAQAIRDEHDGFGRRPSRQVAESFHAARLCAGDDFQQALALMKESLAWRRSAQLEGSRSALKRLDRILDAGSVHSAQPTFAAMACIVKAWERYTQGDTGAARAALEHLQTAPELQPVFRYNPRVRFECLNLLALLHKHAATSKAEPAYRQDEAAAALQALNGALEAAYEADSIDAAQHVAANIGWCMWLFWQQRLIDPEREQAINAVQLQAMRWLGLSEWICDRFGYGSGSAWNLIFMLRIARGNCSPQRSRSLASFRAQQPLALPEVVLALRPLHASLSPAKGFSRWSSAATLALEEQAAGNTAFTPLQQANLLLEAAWFLLHEQGAGPEAADALARLQAQLPSLRRGERSFFNSELQNLPIEAPSAG
ncbi:hypothetical protein [Chromobacterium aquaticum]|uniref:Uncharacterized protein n=1 Tax=Chromobacterium aquaticum TaxID=467180 RepID=A0ABV8ZWE3_9NEIS|nr:hypothetical protein [Chromobacterium aquaticum]MCD5362401.1 hypothetical protein [Chromobacterium aquaticum]